VYGAEVSKATITAITDRVMEGLADWQSTRAALIYQHATPERDEAIAAGMGKMLRQARRTKAAGGAAGTQQRSGTQRARARKRAS